MVRGDAPVRHEAAPAVPSLGFLDGNQETESKQGRKKI